MDDATHKQLDDLRRAYESGVLPKDTYEAMVKQLGGETIQAKGGAAVRGNDNTALGRDALNVQESKISGVIIKGDNNIVNTLIQQTDTTLTPNQLRQEIGRYLNWVINENSTITLRGIQHDGRNVIDLQLDRVYVPLAAQVTPAYLQASRQSFSDDAIAKREKIIGTNELLLQGHRLIVTGGPGCGKTTVLMFIAWTLATTIVQNDPTFATEKLSLTSSYPLPILIPLNRYAAYLRDLPIGSNAKRHTLATFISHHLIKRQSSLSLPADFFSQLLQRKQHIILLLDGLDEVANETQRGKVTQAIEDLVKGHPDLLLVVTCRTAAYQGNTILGQGFREIKVQQLKQEHINALVRQAYQAIYPREPVKSITQSSELLAGIQSIESERRRRLGDGTERLITSPLLVRMLLLVYMSDRRLPEQRAELYQKATQNLLQALYNRDQHVAESLMQRVGGKLKHLELVQYVAFYIHLRGEQQGREIDEFDLRRELQQHEEFQEHLTDFLALTRERGTVMEERGQLYRFIHLGFQEFLVARHMAEILLFDQTLYSFLETEERLTDSWWREPILLLVGYLSLTNTRRAEGVIRYLAGIDGRPLTSLSPTMQWAGAELAATATLEWPTATRSLKDAIAQRLADLITINDTTVTIHRRADLGTVLGRLGDPRKGVGITKDGLPCIVWSKIIPVGMYRIGIKKDIVTINEAYQLSIYPVTSMQYQTFIDAPDYEDPRWWEAMPDGEMQLHNQYFDNSNHPHNMVNWYEATAFCRWVSDKMGKEIVLPHENQWEIAARYNDGRVYPWGNEFDKEKVNSKESGLNQTTAVGIYPQGRNSTLQVYDMSGNVYEWCSNKYYQPDALIVDDSRDGRAVRGGSFHNSAFEVMAAYRGILLPDHRDQYLGFRLCLRHPC